MTDNFSDGWIEFELFLDQLFAKRKLKIEDVEQYVKMYKENHT